MIGPAAFLAAGLSMVLLAVAIHTRIAPQRSDPRLKILAAFTASSILWTTAYQWLLLSNPGLPLAAVLAATISSLLALLLVHGDANVWRDAGLSTRNAVMDLLETLSTPLWSVIGILTVLSVATVRIYGDIGFDSHTYHGVILGSTIQHGGSLGWNLFTPWQGYPGFIETQASVLSLIGAARWAPLFQLPYAVGILVLVFVAIRPVSTLLANLSSLALAAMPVFWLETRTLYTDLPMAFVCVLSMILLIDLLYERDRVRERALLVSVIAAAPLAIKFGGSVGLLLVLLIPIAVAVAHGSGLRLRGTLSLIGAWALIAVFVGAPTYVRNWIEYESPTYPVALGPFAGRFDVPTMRYLVDELQRPEPWEGMGRFEVRFHSLVLSSFDHFGHIGELQAFEPLYTYAPRVGGFGPIWLLMSAAGAGVAGWASIRTRRPAREFAMIALGIAMILAFPGGWFARFSLGPAIGVLIGASWALGALRAPTRPWTRWVVAVVVAAIVALTAQSVLLSEATRGTIAAVRRTNVDTELRRLADRAGTGMVSTSVAGRLAVCDATTILVVGPGLRHSSPLWGPDFDWVVQREPEPAPFLDDQRLLGVDAVVFKLVPATEPLLVDLQLWDAWVEFPFATSGPPHDDVRIFVPASAPCVAEF